MRKVLVTAALLMLGSTAASAQTTLSRCYVETSAAGTFLKSGDRTAQGGVGGGCDITAGLVTAGAGIRADIGDWTAGSAFAKIGILVNANLSLYGLAEWRVPDIKLARAGQLQLGAGAETSLGAIPGLSLFGEASTSAAKFGSGAARDDVLIRLGLRYRF